MDGSANITSTERIIGQGSKNKNDSTNLAYFGVKFANRMRCFNPFVQYHRPPMRDKDPQKRLEISHFFFKLCSKERLILTINGQVFE